MDRYIAARTSAVEVRGLFLWVFPLIRVAHPPLFIPWREISVTRNKFLGTRQVKFRLGHELQIPLIIRESLGQKLEAAAGSSWPRETING